MNETDEKRSSFSYLRLCALVLAVVLTFHLISPAAGAWASRNHSSQRVEETSMETEPPPQASDYLLLAEQAIAEEDYETAVIWLEEARTLTTQDDQELLANIMVKSVSLRILQEQYQEAVSDIDDYHKKYGDSTGNELDGILQFLKAGCLQQLGEHSRAISAFQSAQELGYDSVICLEQIMLSQLEIGDYEALTATGNTLLTMEEIRLNDPGFVYQQLGIGYVYLGDYEQGLRFLDQANEAMNQPQGNGYYRGVCLTSLDREQEAVEAFTAAIEAAELESYSYYNRGICYIELLEYEKAKADMEQVLALGEEADLLESAEAVLQQLQ